MVLCDLERRVLVFQDTAISMTISMAIGVTICIAVRVAIGVAIGVPVGVPVGVSVRGFLCLCGVHSRVRKAHDRTDFNSSVVVTGGVGGQRGSDGIIYLYPTLFAFGL